MAEGNEQAKTAGASPPPLPANVMPIVPARQAVLFPGMVLPLTIGRPISIAAAQEAIRSERPAGIILQRDPTVEDPTSDQLYRVGTTAPILRYVATADGVHHAICRGE